MEAGTRLTGTMVGTPAYMAPEQVAGKPVVPRADIYSLGLMLYEMFTGAPLFSRTSIAISTKQQRDTPPPPHEVEPAIPTEIERAILKCLEKDPARQFQSIAELERALRGAAASASAAPTTAQSTHVSGSRLSHGIGRRTRTAAAPRFNPIEAGEANARLRLGSRRHISRSRRHERDARDGHRENIAENCAAAFARSSRASGICDGQVRSRERAGPSPRTCAGTRSGTQPRTGSRVRRAGREIGSRAPLSEQRHQRWSRCTHGKISVVQLAAAKEARADTADASLAAQRSPDRRRALYLSS